MVENPHKKIINRFLKSKTSKIASILFLISYVLLILTYTRIFDLDAIELTSTSFTKILAIISLVVSIALFMFSYLEGNNKNDEVLKNINNTKNEDFSKIIEDFNHILRRERFENKENFESLLKKISEKPRVDFNIENKDELFQDLKKSISKNINQDFFRELNINISKEVTEENKNQFKEIFYSYRSLTDRIYREIEKLDRKSNINLIIGSVMTIVALICLGYIVFDKHDDLITTEKILIHFIPRISFILFIEVFAFFFLRLYKLNLNDIKYYQNELTNIDLKNISLSSSVNFGLSEDISATIRELSKTERNFIINKGQSTIELEKFKYDQNSIEKFSKIFKNILKSK